MNYPCLIIDTASNIALSPVSENNEYCVGDVLTVVYSSNPAPHTINWFIQIGGDLHIRFLLLHSLFVKLNQEWFTGVFRAL